VVEEYTAASLEANKSVLQVYYCLGLACWALKDEFLQWVVSVEEKHHALRYLLSTELDQGVVRKPQIDMYKPDYREEQEFHIFLPLACAVSLCDGIEVGELTYSVVQLAADLIPPLSTSKYHGQPLNIFRSVLNTTLNLVGILIKASHDLHEFISGEYLMDVRYLAPTSSILSF
jgi:hypothetical protein